MKYRQEQIHRQLL